MLVGKDQTPHLLYQELPVSRGDSWPKGTRPSRFLPWPFTHPGRKFQLKICHHLVRIFLTDCAIESISKKYNLSVYVKFIVVVIVTYYFIIIIILLVE